MQSLSFTIIVKGLPALAEVTTALGRSKTWPCERCMSSNSTLLRFPFHRRHFEGRLRDSMAEPGQYPPPDFGCPPPSSFQHQPHSRPGSFHPSMWSWSSTPTEPSWDHGGPAGWHSGGAPWFGSAQNHWGHGPGRPYGELLKTPEVWLSDHWNLTFFIF